jgi:hypothetical protein
MDVQLKIAICDIMRSFAIMKGESTLEIVMAQSVRLSDSLVKQAQSVGAVMSRSGAGQIEYWAKIGKIAEENPELTYGFIRDSLISKAEVENGLVDDYEFDN